MFVQMNTGTSVSEETVRKWLYEERSIVSTHAFSKALHVHVFNTREMHEALEE